MNLTNLIPGINEKGGCEFQIWAPGVGEVTLLDTKNEIEYPMAENDRGN